MSKLNANLIKLSQWQHFVKTWPFWLKRLFLLNKSLKTFIIVLQLSASIANLISVQWVQFSFTWLATQSLIQIARHWKQQTQIKQIECGFRSSLSKLVDQFGITINTLEDSKLLKVHIYLSLSKLDKYKCFMGVQIWIN